jgi:hypothetical protein
MAKSLDGKLPDNRGIPFFIAFTMPDVNDAGFQVDVVPAQFAQFGTTDGGIGQRRNQSRVACFEQLVENIAVQLIRPHPQHPMGLSRGQRHLDPFAVGGFDGWGRVVV